jgi:L-ascorbate metabolism protein UlaG (beta-lactamase superfamily)
VTDVRLTHIGGPTVLIEVGGWRLLTDPTFDAPGRRYRFGWGTGSRKLAGPAVPPSDLGRIDAILLTHDHHDDNLDAAGRALLPRAGVVVTTVPGAKRLGHGARGLAPWSTTRLEGPGRPAIEITATPCRHGPPLSRPIVGQVVGFAIRRAGGSRVLVWVTGDTVLYGGLRDAAKSLDVDVLVVHVGGVQFPITGPLRYTMTGRDAVELVGLARPRVAVPVHYEGWAHFKDGRAGIDRALAATSADTRGRVRQLTLGSPTNLA